MAPMALAPAIIRWGADASSNVLRQRMRCTACGSLGATLQHPSRVDSIVGLAPFPFAKEKAIAAVELDELPSIYHPRG
jgi:hypothetical protein